MDKLKVFTDWWSRWNPWISWLWVFITDFDWNEVEKRFKSLGIKTNNEAEYLWAYYWIKRAIELWAHEVYLYMDSSLVINQLIWTWKIKKEELKVINNDICKLIKESKIKIHYNWIARELNKEADRLSNVAMDKNQ